METRRGWDIYQFMGWILAFIVGILSGALIQKYMKERKEKRGGSKRVRK